MKNSYELFTNFGRTALYLALINSECKGKEVLLPDFTCITTVTSAIYLAGGIPKYVKVNPENLEMDVEDLKKKVGKNSRVIISHHYYGNLSQNISEINKIARKNNLIHIEDCCHLLESQFNNSDFNSDMRIFSFSKYIINPGGGKLVIKDRTLYDKTVNFQRANYSLFHPFINDYLVFSYFEGLKRVKKNSHISGYNNIFRKIFTKILRKLNLYYFPDFYLIDEKKLNKYETFDCRMSPNQRREIEENIKKIEVIKKNRIRIGKFLENKVENLFKDSKNNSYMNFVCKDDNISLLEKKLSDNNIKNMRVWPWFQTYTDEQSGENIIKIRDSLLLIGLDNLTEDKIEKVF